MSHSPSYTFNRSSQIDSIYLSDWDEFRDQVQKHLDLNLVKVIDVFGEEAVNSLFRGKLSRSRLIWLLAKQFNISYDRAVSFACSIETLHEASLVHDDIQDEQLTRRSQPSCLAQVGSSRAINIGNFLVSIAQDHLINANVFTCHQHSMLQSLNKTYRLMTQGQEREFQSALKQNLTQAQYWQTVHEKTCSLLTSPLAAFQISNKSIKEALVILGEIYQMKNDLEDFSKKEESVDFKNKTNSLPIIYLFQMRNQKRSTFWQTTPSTSEVESILKLVNSEVKKKKQRLHLILQDNNFHRIHNELFNLIGESIIKSHAKQEVHE
jgi:geranylgeranyl pyrophosphate synthase